MTRMDKDYYDYNARFFRLLAPLYDPLTFVTFRMREMVVDFAAVAKGAKILDVATGTGQQALAFANRGYEVEGVDLSVDMLIKAHRKFKNKPASLLLTDATALPFVDDSFDVSTVSFGLHEMPQYAREKVAQEMVRVTKHEGKMVIVDYALPQNNLSRHFFYTLIRRYEGKYYPRFINSNLEATLRKFGISVEKRLSFAGGTIRFLRGRNRKETF